MTNEVIHRYAHHPHIKLHLACIAKFQAQVFYRAIVKKISQSVSHPHSHPLAHLMHREPQTLLRKKQECTMIANVSMERMHSLHLGQLSSNYEQTLVKIFHCSIVH